MSVGLNAEHVEGISPEICIKCSVTGINRIRVQLQNRYFSIVLERTRNVTVVNKIFLYTNNFKSISIVV
jgi:hypothetical protein